MARPEAFGRQDRRFGQGEDGTGGDDGLAAHDHRSVMERRPGHEDRPKEIRGQVSVEHHPGLGNLAEGRLALDHDQGAVVVRRQQATGAGHLGRYVADDAPVRPAQEPGERTNPADSVECPAELRLEDHHEGEDADQCARLEDLAEEPEIEEAGGGIDQQHHRYPDHEADGAGPPDQAEQTVDQEGRDPDIDHGVELDLAEDRLDELHRALSLGQAHSPASRLSSGSRRVAAAHSRSRTAASPDSSTRRPRSSSLSPASVRQPRAT